MEEKRVIKIINFLGLMLLIVSITVICKELMTTLDVLRMVISFFVGVGGLLLTIIGGEYFE